MNIDTAVRIFNSFMNSSWDTVMMLLVGRDYNSDENVIGDWLQANWELLVESKILPKHQHLEIYSAGADYNGTSSRIIDADAMPDFCVIVNSLTLTNDLLSEELINPNGLIFDEFVGFENGFHVLKPPFKYALLHDDQSNTERVISIDDITFELKRL